MKVRAFDANDLAAVYAIQTRCSQAAQWRQEDYLHLARDPGGTILVAEIEAASSPEVIGFAVFHRVMDEAELRNLAIDPAHQRKGIARALLAAGIRAMQESGVGRLFLEVRASNQPALGFYASAGFQLLYTRREYYQDPVENGLVLARDIPAILPPP
ncbi:MAG: ribosomal protein S18-alanine N-acetyltransferase [Terriglobia bacterium]|jgi:ribosomal-protein-alanine N-acetyltransferase